MAYFPPANGDSQPVFALDINNGAQTGNIGTTAALVQPQGPHLNFFGVVVKNGSAQAINLQNQLGNITGSTFYPGLVNYINSAIQRTATIAIYQVEGSSAGQISYALYPNAAYDATTLQQTIQGLGNVQITSSDGTVTGINVSGTTVTDYGFKLALS